MFHHVKKLQYNVRISKGDESKGPWNKGKSPEMSEDWQYIDNPIDRVKGTRGLIDEETKGTKRTEQLVQKDNMTLSAKRKAKIEKATHPEHVILSWSVY